MKQQEQPLLWIVEVKSRNLLHIEGQYIFFYRDAQNQSYLKDDSNKQFTPQTSAGSLQYGFQ